MWIMGFHIISLMLINVEVLDHIAYWRPSENFRNHDFLQCVHKHEHEPNLGSQNGMIQRLSTLKAWQVDIWLPPSHSVVTHYLAFISHFCQSRLETLVPIEGFRKMGLSSIKRSDFPWHAVNHPALGVAPFKAKRLSILSHGLKICPNFGWFGGSKWIEMGNPQFRTSLRTPYHPLPSFGISSRLSRRLGRRRHALRAWRMRRTSWAIGIH